MTKFITYPDGAQTELTRESLAQYRAWVSYHPEARAAGLTVYDADQYEAILSSESSEEASTEISDEQVEDLFKYMDSLFGEAVTSAQKKVEQEHIEKMRQRWIERIDHDDYLEFHVIMTKGDYISIDKAKFIEWYNDVAECYNEFHGPLDFENINDRMIDEEILMYFQIVMGYSNAEFAPPVRDEFKNEDYSQ